MADGLKGIIAQLQRQKTAIERALSALGAIEGAEAPTQTSSAPATRKGGMTPAGRKRLSAALRKRWAAKKAAEGAPAATLPKTARRKGGMTPEGRQRLADAMRRRWAVKRTAAQARKRGRKAA